MLPCVYSEPSATRFIPFACSVLALGSLHLFGCKPCAARRLITSHPPDGLSLSQLTLDRSRRNKRVHRGTSLVTSRHGVRPYQPPASTRNSFAMNILPVSSMESRSCKPNRKSLKTSHLNIELSPMFGRSYGQVIENGDLTNFIFPRFF